MSAAGQEGKTLRDKPLAEIVKAVAGGDAKLPVKELVGKYPHARSREIVEAGRR